jgi:long-chain acyl-CoA synthetase
MASNIRLGSRLTIASRETSRVQTTFPRLMLQHAAERPQSPALREKEYGIWQTTTWGELAQLVRDLAGGLAAAGLARGQHIVVVGSNRPRLYAAMLAAQSLGAVPIPLYQDAAAAEFVFPLNNAEVAFAVVEDQEQVDKLLELRAQCPPHRIWYDDRAACALCRARWLRSTTARSGARRGPAAPRFSTPSAKSERDVRVFFTRAHQPEGCGAQRTLLDRMAGAQTHKLTAPTRCCYMRRPGSGRTSSAMRSGWPAATSSTAPSRHPR